MSTKPTRYPEKYETIFVFHSKKVFLNFLISEGCTVEREGLTVPTLCPE